MCIATEGCTAFQYDQDTGYCALGKRSDVQTSSNGAEIVTLFVNSDGKLYQIQQDLKL
jgi:hypothetical protein